MDVLIIVLAIFGITLGGAQPISEEFNVPTNNQAIPGLFIPADVLKELREKAELKNKHNLVIDRKSTISEKILNGITDHSKNPKNENNSITKIPKPLMKQLMTHEQPITNQVLPSENQQQVLMPSPSQQVLRPASNPQQVLTERKSQQVSTTQQQVIMPSSSQPVLRPVPNEQQVLTELKSNQVLTPSTNQLPVLRTLASQQGVPNSLNPRNISEISYVPLNKQDMPGIFIPADVLKALQEKTELQNEHPVVPKQKNIIVGNELKEIDGTKIAEKEDKPDPLINQPSRSQQPVINQVLTPSSNQQQVFTTSPSQQVLTPLTNQQILTILQSQQGLKDSSVPTNLVSNLTPDSNRKTVSLAGSNQMYLLTSAPQQAISMNQQLYLSNRQPILSSQQPIPSIEQPTLTSPWPILTMESSPVLMKNQNGLVLLQNANSSNQREQYLFQSSKDVPNHNGATYLQITVPNQNGPILPQNIPTQNTIVAIPTNNLDTLQNTDGRSNLNVGLQLYAMIPIQNSQ